MTARRVHRFHNCLHTQPHSQLACLFIHSLSVFAEILPIREPDTEFREQAYGMEHVFNIHRPRISANRPIPASHSETIHAPAYGSQATHIGILAPHKLIRCCQLLCTLSYECIFEGERESLRMAFSCGRLLDGNTRFGYTR